MNAARMPAGLRGRLRRVDDALLVARYRAALDRICGKSTALASFHVDAAGWSPEIAEELDDPFYLGQGPDHPFFILLGVGQLAGCLLQPNAGFAAHAFRAFTTQHRAELADLTVREAAYGEVAHGKTAFRKPEELGLVRELTVSLDSVSGRIRVARSLAAMREKLLASDTLWHDEAFLESMRDSARTVQGYLPGRGGAADPVRYDAGPAFVTRYSGAYVIPQREGPAGDRTWVLATEVHASAVCELESGRFVLVSPLTVETALQVLAELEWVELAPTGAQLEAPLLDAMQTWLALDYLRRAGEPFPANDDPAWLRRAMRSRQDAPADYLELEEVRMKAARPSDWVELARYAPLTRLRALAVKTTDPAQRAIVRHIQAFLDPLNVPRAYRDAPDVFWSRRETVPVAMLDLIPRWIDPVEELFACR